MGDCPAFRVKIALQSGTAQNAPAFSMKMIYLLVLALICSTGAFSQNVGINNYNLSPDPSAMLDVYSTDKGILIPRMRSSDRQGISSPAEGLLVYDVDAKSFWYYLSGAWKEIPNTAYLMTPGGPALGDLYGTYPAPSVGKIQNLEVAAGVPFDHQVMKWDALNNRWQGLNDSLFLPYNAASGNPAKLFGITNNNITTGSVAVYGKSGSTATGFTPTYTMGVWGESSNGLGVLGVSNAAAGVYGSSAASNGVYGITSAAGSAGIYGKGNANGSIAVYGELPGTGYAIYGASQSGKAGYFRNINAANTDTALTVLHDGTGQALNITQTNALNGTETMVINDGGTGIGLSMNITNGNNSNPGLRILHSGTGTGIASFVNNGKAGLFQVNSLTNINTALEANTFGTGKAGSFSINNASNNNTAIAVSTTGTGGAESLTISNTANNSDILTASTNGGGGGATFTINNTANSNDILSLSSNGTGRGIYINLTNTAVNNPGIQVITSGKAGITVSTINATSPVGILSATSTVATNGIAIKGVAGASGTNGIGVLGQAGSNDPSGIGVKGIAGGGCCNVGIGVLGEANAVNGASIGIKGTSYSANHTIGSVTGINFSSGAGVYGEAQDFDGIGVVGLVGNTSQNSKAAQFKNVYSGNTMDVLEVISNGMGTSIFSDNTNLSNPQPIFRLRNAGTGDFLKFETNLAAVITRVQKDGDIITAGSLTVRDNKGIVRNSTSTQVMSVLMTVNITAGSLSHYEPGGFNSIDIIPVTFTSSFSATPFVFLGNTNITSAITASIRNVTTTGCELWLQNWGPASESYSASTIKILAMGAE